MYDLFYTAIIFTTGGDHQVITKPGGIAGIAGQVGGGALGSVLYGPGNSCRSFVFCVGFCFAGIATGKDKCCNDNNKGIVLHDDKVKKLKLPPPARRNNNKNRVYVVPDNTRDQESGIFTKMNCMRGLCLVMLMFCSTGFAWGQSDAGYYTSEAQSIAADGQVYVSIKKYNPTPEEIKKADARVKDNEMNYLHLPVFATNVSFFDKSFECGLYCFGTDGKLKWGKTIGFSANSVSPPLAAREGFIYSGAGMKSEDKIVITKLNPEGKISWQQELDSLDEVNDVAVHQGKVNVLASFKRNVKKEHDNGTYSIDSYPIYFFIQLDPATGRVLSKQYQRMGNYLSSIGYGNPFISTDQSYYLRKADSAIFLNTANQEGGIVVSQDMPAGNKIQVLTAGPSSYHYITEFSPRGEKPVYKLFTDFYGEKKKYETVLPAAWSDEPFNRIYLVRHSSDSVFSFITTGIKVTVSVTDKEGKTAVIQQNNNPRGLVIGAGLNGSQPFIIRLAGRVKRSEPGVFSPLFF